MDGPEPAFTLSLAGGRAMVVCRGQRLGPLRLQRLEMEVPDVRFPLDLAGGPQQFRRRWCTLRDAELEALEDDLRPLFRLRSAEQLGLESVDLALRDGYGLLFGTALSGGQRADFTARIALEIRGTRDLQLSLFDVLLYGPLDMPPPALGAALLGVAGAECLGDTRRFGATEVEVRPLDDLLERLLPSVGWRVPDRRSTRLVRAELLEGRVALVFSGTFQGDQVFAGRDEAQARLAREARDRFAEGDQRLARGDFRGAVVTTRADLLRHPDDPFLLERAVGLLAVLPESRGEAAQIASRALALDPRSVSALLALGILAEGSGREDEAALRYDEAAAQLTHGGAPEEQMAALVAAARVHERGRPAEAASRLEEVLRRRTDHEGALEALDRIYQACARPADRVRILHRRAALTSDPKRGASLRVALGRVYIESLDDVEMGRAELERARAVLPDEPDTLAALADACVRMGEVARAVELLDRLASIALGAGQRAIGLDALVRCAGLLERSDPDDAMARLRRVVEADPARGDVRLRLARHAGMAGRIADALENYEAALACLGEAERASALVEIARLRASSDDPRSAHASVWRALGAHQPPEVELELLDLAGRVAEARDDAAELADVLGRFAERVEEPARKGAALLRRGELLAGAGRGDEAGAVLDQAARLGADGAVAALERLAQSHERAGRSDARRATLGQITMLSDREAADRARLQLAGMAERAGDLVEARTQLEVAARGATERPALLALRELLARTGETHAEEAVLTRMLRLEPENAETMRRRADLLVALGRLDEASQQIEALLRHSPESERAVWLLRLGAIAEGMGQGRQAFSRYREALAAGLGPRAREAYQHLRRLAADRQDWDLAARLTRAEAEEVALAEPERIALLIEAASLWRERADRPQEAEACLRRALDIQPDHDEALRALEDLLRERGDRARVAEILERRAQAASGQPEVELTLLLELAVTRLATGQVDGARYAFLRCLAILPGCKPALLALGKMALERGDEQEARAHLSELAGQRDGDALVLEARRLLARAAGAAGREFEELDALRALLDLEDDPAERFRVASRIGELRAASGDREDALLAYRRALDANPDHPPTLWAIARLMGEAGRFYEHAAALERLLSLPPAPGVPDAQALLALLRELYGSVPEAALADPSTATRLAEERKLEELAALYAEESARRSAGPAAAALSVQAARLYEGPLGSEEAAAEAWLQAARADPGAAVAPARRAAELLLHGDPSRAALALEIALRAAPVDEAPPLLARRADALLLAGRSAEAAADLRKAVAADPGLFVARAQLGELLLGLGDREGAVAHLAAAAQGLDEDARAARCATLAAEALLALGRADDAVAQWESAATRAPHDPAPLVALLGWAETAHDHERAVDLATRAAALEPDPLRRSSLELARARALGALGRHDDAYAAARKALELDRTPEARRLVRAAAEAREDWPELAALLRDEAEGESEALRARASLELGQTLERLTAPGEAAGAYERAASLDPGLRAAHEALVRLHGAAGRFSEAARAAEALVGLAGSPEEEGKRSFEAGAFRIRAGEPDAARLLLAYACERPGVAGDKALLALARLANDSAKRRQVRDLARVRLEAHPSPEERTALLQKLTDHFAKTVGREEAEALARELRASGSEVLDELSVDALEAKEGEEAVEEVSLDAIVPDGAEADFARGARNEAEGQALAARAAYARVLQEDPDHVPALDALADLAFREGDLSLASALYDRLTGRGSRISPAELEFRLGVIAEARGEGGAIERFKNALRHDPRHGPALEAIARIDLDATDDAAALGRLRAMLDSLPAEDVVGAVDLRERIAGLELASGDEVRARKGFLDVLRHDPYRASALDPLVGLYQRAGDWGEAADGIERLAGLSGDTATRVERLCLLAELCYGRLGDAQRAIEALQRAADVAEDAGPVLLKLTDLYWETGDLERVTEMAAEVQRIEGDPGPERAARLAIALAVRGRGDEARRHVAGSLVEAIAQALADAAGRGIDVAPALPDVAPTVADRAALAEALRAIPGAERVLALLGTV